MVAGFLPSELGDASVGIVCQVGVLHLVDECLVVHLSAKFVTETNVNAQTHVGERRVDISLPCRLGIAVGHSIGAAIAGLVGQFAIALDEYLVAGSGVDAQRRHNPNARHGVSLLVSWQRTVLQFVSALLVDVAHSLRNLNKLVLVVRPVERDSPVSLLGWVAIRYCREADLPTLILNLAKVFGIGCKSE